MQWSAEMERRPDLMTNEPHPDTPIYNRIIRRHKDPSHKPLDDEANKKEA